MSEVSELNRLTFDNLVFVNIEPDNVMKKGEVFTRILYGTSGTSSQFKTIEDNIKIAELGHRVGERLKTLLNQNEAK